MRALLLAGLPALAALLLLPSALAGPPLDQPWRVDLGSGALNAGAATGLGFDEGGSRIVLSTTDRQAGPDNDFVQVLFDQGNATAEEDGSTALGEGKETASISGDGRFAVAGANHTGGTLNGPNLFFYALPDLRPVWTQALTQPLTTSAMNREGTVIIVGSLNTTQGPGRLYHFSQGGDQRWQVAVDRCGTTVGSGGSVLAIDLSTNGRWLAVGTAFGAPDGPRGCVMLFDTNSLNPVMCFVVPTVGTGDVTAVDASPSGEWVAAGTKGGRFFLFHNSAGENRCPFTGNPLQDQLNALAPVLAVRAEDTGQALIVADAVSVNRYVHLPGTLALNWSAPVQGLRSLDATPPLDYVVAGASQLTAFHESGNTSLWSVDMARPLVKVAQNSPNDLRIAAASGSAVRGFRLHWAFEVRKTEPEPVALAAGQPRPVQLLVANSGSAADAVLLSVPGSAGFQVSVEPPQMTLLPGQAGNATLTILPTPGAEARLYQLQVDARGTRSGVTASTTLNATLGAAPRLAIALADPGQADRAVQRGDEVAVVLQVQNAGNARLDISYDVTQAPNVGAPWEASMARTTGVLDPFGITTNSLNVRVPLDAKNGTEDVFNVTARAEGIQASVSMRMVVNPIFTGTIQVIPQSKIVAPGKSVSYTVVVSNNGTLRETYRIVYCVTLPDLIPCLGNATLGLGGWGVSLDTSPFALDHDQSRSFPMAVAAPRGAIPRVDKLALQVEVISADFEHRFRDTKVVVTAVEAEAPPSKPPNFTPGFEPLAAALALGALARMRRR